MRSAPNPKKKTSPLVWVGLVGAVAIVYLTMDSGPDPSTLKSSTAKKKKTTTKTDGIFTPEDETAKFPPLQLASVNDAFTPAVRKIVPPPALPPVNPGTGNIPASITGGDGNWYFTGIVEVNGRKQALLENTTSGETSYVSSGEGWKAGRISTVDISAVVMVAPDGAVVRVALQEYGASPGASPTRIASAGGSQPLSLPAGTIGAGVPGGLGVRPVGGTATVQLPSGQTIQVPLDANATNDQNSNQNGGRRRRNRQQQNPGDQNNGL